MVVKTFPKIAAAHACVLREVGDGVAELVGGAMVVGAVVLPPIPIALGATVAGRGGGGNVGGSGDDGGGGIFCPNLPLVGEGVGSSPS